LGVIAESVPNRTLRGSGMIPRLDVAVDGRRRARPVWRAALCGQHAALESVTERLRGTIPILAARAELSRPRNVPEKFPAHIASLGWEHIGFSGGYVWPSEPLKQKVSALRKLRSAFRRCRVPYDLEQILR
jgi:hypothetical protein